MADVEFVMVNESDEKSFIDKLNSILKNSDELQTEWIQIEYKKWIALVRVLNYRN